MVKKHVAPLAMLWGSEPPIHSIGYESPTSEYDSGFTVLFADAPDPDELVDDDPRIEWVCVHLPDRGSSGDRPRPDVAREHEVANLEDDGVWQAGSLSGLEDEL